jgi:ABC-type transporter Mla subunit MlaD
MADEPAVPHPDAVVADTAQLAANAAERAQEAAAATMEHAQIAVADVTHQAAEQIAETQQGLSEWQNSIATQQEKLSRDVIAQREALEAKLAETMAAVTSQLSSIQERLPPPPRSPANPDPGSNETITPASTEPRSPPKEESPPRKRAHRWI